jgi:hypothetical protein
VALATLERIVWATWVQRGLPCVAFEQIAAYLTADHIVDERQELRWADSLPMQSAVAQGKTPDVFGVSNQRNQSA